MLVEAFCRTVGGLRSVALEKAAILTGNNFCGWRVDSMGAMVDFNMVCFSFCFNRDRDNLFPLAAIFTGNNLLIKF